MVYLRSHFFYKISSEGTMVFGFLGISIYYKNLFYLQQAKRHIYLLVFWYNNL